VSQMKNREPMLPTGHSGAHDHLSEVLSDCRNASHAHSGWRGRGVGVGGKHRKSRARNRVRVAGCGVQRNPPAPKPRNLVLAPNA
jgi:hypothetical protein